MKVLITGGTGFLGRHTAVRLLAKGDQVTILGRNEKVGRIMEAHGAHFLKVDLAEREAIFDACRDQEQVIHCGGLASPWGKYEAFYAANVVGTQNVVDGCIKASVKRMIHLSTPSLYFDYRDRKGIQEADPLPKRFATPYAATKFLADEAVAKGAAQGLSAVSLRPRAIFGPGDKTVLGRLMRMAETGRVPLIAGGNSYLDLTYIDNAVDSILLAMKADDSLSGHTFNITNDEPMTSKAMMTLLFQKLGTSVTFRSIPFRLAYLAGGAAEIFYVWFRPGLEPPVTRYALGLLGKSQTLDITQAKQRLGYAPRISIDEGMNRFVKWWTEKSDEFGDLAR